MRLFIGTLFRFIAFIPAYVGASLRLGTMQGRRTAEADANPPAPQAAPKEQ